MIRMKSGTYGLLSNGTVQAKNKHSEPFVAGAEQEARLVKLGVAEYVHMEVQPVSEDMPPLPDGVVGIPEYSADMTVAQLREIGALAGLTFAEGLTKAQMVEVLDNHIAAHAAPPDKPLDEMTGKELRAYGALYGLEFAGNAKKADMVAMIQDAMAAQAEDDEDAPAFDATQAVQ